MHKLSYLLSIVLLLAIHQLQAQLLSEYLNPLSNFAGDELSEGIFKK